MTPRQFDRALVACLPAISRLAAEISAEPEDLVQDVMVEALTYRADFNPDHIAMDLWLGRIAFNLAGYTLAIADFPQLRRTACAS